MEGIQSENDQSVCLSNRLNLAKIWFEKSSARLGHRMTPPFFA